MSGILDLGLAIGVRSGAFVAGGGGVWCGFHQRGGWGGWVSSFACFVSFGPGVPAVAVSCRVGVRLFWRFRLVLLGVGRAGCRCEGRC